MIRTIVEYIEKKTKRWNNNDLAKCVICFCKCCLWCLEKFMRFINRNAYIMCAVKVIFFYKCLLNFSFKSEENHFSRERTSANPQQPPST